MATSTYTASAYNTQPKYVEHGVVEVSGKVQWTAAGTVGDILYCAKIPNGARIVDFKEYHTNGETALALDWGFNRGIASGGGANASCLVSGGAIATMNRMSYAASPTGGPLTISLSDLDPNGFAVLIGKAASGTATISASVAFSILYRMEGPSNG
jgi:hypothetical protein